MANPFLEALSVELESLVTEAHPYRFGEEIFWLPNWTPKQYWYWLDQSQHVRYSGIVQRILDHSNWSAKFSEQFVRGEVKRIFDEALDQGVERIGPLLDDMSARLDAYATEHLVIVPIQGMKLCMEQLHVGKVVLKPVTESYAAYLDSLGGMSTQYRLKGMNARVCGEYRIVAEQFRARDRAEEECRRSIDVIRYWMSFSVREGERRLSVGLFPELIDGVRTIPVIDISTGGVGICNSSVGVLTDFEFTQDIFRHLQRIGVTHISELVRKEPHQLSEFEHLLIAGLHWFGKAEVQPDRTDSFLNLTTVLETFLTQGGVPITNQIAEGVVMFFAIPVEERRQLKKEIQRLYGLR